MGEYTVYLGGFEYAVDLPEAPWTFHVDGDKAWAVPNNSGRYPIALLTDNCGSVGVSWPHMDSAPDQIRSLLGYNPYALPHEAGIPVYASRDATDDVLGMKIVERPDFAPDQIEIVDPIKPVQVFRDDVLGGEK